MLLKLKVSRFKPIRSYSEHHVYKVAGLFTFKTLFAFTKLDFLYPKTSESNYNPADTSFVKKLCEENSSKVTYLNECLDGYEKNRIEKSIKIVNERKNIIKMFQDKLCTPNSRLVPVGSSSSGLLFDRSSDIDLCLYTEDMSFYEDVRNNRGFRSYLFNRARNLFYKIKKVDPKFEVVETLSLPDAHVPILKFYFKNGLAVDIQIPLDEFQAIRNTNLIKHYLLADSRFPQVYVYMKKLFEVLGLRNSTDGLLSSYHLIMLTVHFLQCRSLPAPVLPVLCSLIPHRVGPEVPMDKVLRLIDGEFDGYNLEWQSKNTQSPAELIFEMINYYKHFDFYTNRIFINRGLAVRRLPNKYAAPSLQLIDPYSPITICRSYLIPDAFSTAINYIHRNYTHGKLIDSFPHFYDAQGFQKYIEEKPWASKLKCI